MKRTWRVSGYGNEVDVEDAMVAAGDCFAIQRRLGGAIIIMPERVADGDEHFTASLTFQWHSHAQVVKNVVDEAEPEIDQPTEEIKLDQPTVEMAAVNGE